MQFSKEEYLIIFIAFVYGFVAQEFFQGWGKILRRTKRTAINELYWYHLLWTILAFGLMITFWWDYWDRNAKIAQNIGYFLITLIPPLLFYLITIIIFPSKLGKSTFQLKEYFMGQLPMLLWLIAALLTSDLIITIATDVMNIEDALFLVFSIILAILAALYKRPYLHKLMLVVGFAILIAHFFVE